VLFTFRIVQNQWRPPANSNRYSLHTGSGVKHRALCWAHHWHAWCESLATLQCTIVCAKHAVPKANREILMGNIRRMEAIKFAQKVPIKLRSNTFKEGLCHNSNICAAHLLQLGLPVGCKFPNTLVDKMHISSSWAS